MNRKQLEKILRLKGYSETTIKAYIFQIIQFMNYTRRDLREVTSEDIIEYLLMLLEVKGCSPSYVNQTVSALRLLFIYVVKRGDLVIDIPRPKKKKKLSQVLSQDEV